MSKLGLELRKVRQGLKLSLRAVEEAVGISNAYLSQLERGQVKNPSPQKLKSLAEHYNMSYEYFLQLAGYLNDADSNSVIASDAANHCSFLHKRPSLLQTTIDSANLSPEDEVLASEYISFLCSRRP